MTNHIGNASLRIPPGIRETASEDGGVLLDIDRGICFGLNSVGLKIWESLKQGCNADQIVEVLQHEYPVSRDELTNDVHAFLARLESSGLLGTRPLKKTGGMFRRIFGKNSV